MSAPERIFVSRHHIEDERIDNPAISLTAFMPDDVEYIRADLVKSQQDEIVRQQEELSRLREAYNELLYSVSTKYPDESRHETALRYIRQAEQRTDTACAALEGGKK